MSHSARILFNKLLILSWKLWNVAMVARLEVAIVRSKHCFATVLPYSASLRSSFLLAKSFPLNPFRLVWMDCFLVKGLDTRPIFPSHYPRCLANG